MRTERENGKACACRNFAEILNDLLPDEGLILRLRVEKDPLAIGAMNYALDHGVRIPQDLAMIGCGNLHYDDSLRVPLSSIDQDSQRIGAEAARITLGILNSKVRPKREVIVLQPQLVGRRSTKRDT